MLRNGLYEQVINKALEGELATTDKLVETAPIDGGESSKVLSKYNSFTNVHKLIDALKLEKNIDAIIDAEKGFKEKFNRGEKDESGESKSNK